MAGPLMDITRPNHPLKDHSGNEWIARIRGQDLTPQHHLYQGHFPLANILQVAGWCWTNIVRVKFFNEDLAYTKEPPPNVYRGTTDHRCWTNIVRVRQLVLDKYSQSRIFQRKTSVYRGTTDHRPPPTTDHRSTGVFAKYGLSSPNAVFHSSSFARTCWSD